MTFDVVKTTASNTTPLKTLTDREDPASDYFVYVSGDVNGNNTLDTAEKRSYRGPVIGQSGNQPTAGRGRFSSPPTTRREPEGGPTPRPLSR